MIRPSRLSEVVRRTPPELNRPLELYRYCDSVLVVNFDGDWGSYFCRAEIEFDATAPGPFDVILVRDSGLLSQQIRSWERLSDRVRLRGLFALWPVEMEFECLWRSRGGVVVGEVALFEGDCNDMVQDPVRGSAGGRGCGSGSAESVGVGVESG